MRRLWTQEETERLKALFAAGLLHREIALEMDRTTKAIGLRLKYLRMTPRQRELVWQRKTPVRRSRINKDRVHLNAPLILESRPAPELLTERDVRFSTPFRDLAGFVFGDPPIGYSALDLRR